MLTFFTDITTNSSNYCLLNINKLSDIRKKNKKIIFIDPSVYELKKSPEYKNIIELHILANLSLDYISIDYPCDMNKQYTELFIEKTRINNLFYQNNEKYINTIQYKFQEFEDFKKQWEYNEPFFKNKNKIVGIGNLCRILHPNLFTDKLFSFLIKKQSIVKTYHFYGLAFRLIRKYLPQFEIDISMDSTKWTRAITNEFKLNHGAACRKHNRELYFLEYMKEVAKLIEVRY